MNSDNLAASLVHSQGTPGCHSTHFGNQVLYGEETL